MARGNLAPISKNVKLALQNLASEFLYGGVKFRENLAAGFYFSISMATCLSVDTSRSAFVVGAYK